MILKARGHFFSSNQSIKGSKADERIIATKNKAKASLIKKRKPTNIKIKIVRTMVSVEIEMFCFAIIFIYFFKILINLFLLVKGPMMLKLHFDQSIKSAAKAFICFKLILSN